MNETRFIRLPLEGATFDKLNADWSVLIPALDLSATGDDPYAVISGVTFVSLCVSMCGDTELHYRYSWHLFHACRDYRDQGVCSALIRGKLRSGELVFPVLSLASERSTADEL